VASLYLALELRERNAARAQAFERQAIEDAERLVEQNPRAAWPHELQAFVLSKLGLLEEARRAGDLAQERGRELPSQLDQHFGALNALAAGDPERAAALLTEVIDNHPGQQTALLNRARAYEQLGRLEEAILDYRVAVGLSPDDGLARYNLGVLLTWVGRPDEGGRYLDRARELGGYAGLADNLLARGRAAQGAGRTEAALELFRQAEQEARAGLESAPTLRRVPASDLPSLHLNLGASLMEQHRLAGVPGESRIDEAASHYGEALALWKDTRDPRELVGYGRALGSLCDLLIQTGSLDRALEICREATERLPDVATTFYNLAGVHALAGRTEEALAALARDIELGDRDFGYLESDPWFESLRDEPAFQAILERMKRETPGSD
jgi:tetratricopeptide (TPR) repeat protein